MLKEHFQMLPNETELICGAVATLLKAVFLQLNPGLKLGKTNFEIVIEKLLLNSPGLLIVV